jgi:hypothetical protein
MIIISCDKDSDNELKDKIIYLDLTPDLVLHPVDSVGLHPSGFCNEKIPFPTDSTVLIDLDINQDGEDDFRFTYSTFYEWVSASSPCANYNSTLQVSGLTVENKIKVANEDMNEISILKNGDIIDADLLYASNAIIYRDNAMAFLNFGDFSGEGFIGVKLSSGELGWIKLNFEKDSFTCTIMEYGYNETVNSQITAGQIE